MGKPLHVELAGHDREDLPYNLETRLLELDDCVHAANAEGLQLDSASSRAPVLSSET